MPDNNLDANELRAGFLGQIAASAELPFLFMGFFDCLSGKFSGCWIAHNQKVTAVPANKSVSEIEQAVAFDAGAGKGKLITPANKEYVWRRSGIHMIGIGKPISNLLPVTAILADGWSENPSMQVVLRIALAYAQQELTKTVYSRSPWPEGLIEATLQTLSLRFFLVNKMAEIQRDGRLDEDPLPDDPAWIVLAMRLTLRNRIECEKLHEAIRKATGPTKITSIIPVSTVSGIMRLGVVAPIAHTDPPLAMVLFEHSKTDHTAMRQHFYEAYGLSASERKIANFILDGRTPVEAADATELSVATVRSYLKLIFAKTETHRQSELIALYYRSVLPVGISIAKAEQKVGTLQALPAPKVKNGEALRTHSL